MSRFPNKRGGRQNQPWGSQRDRTPYYDARMYNPDPANQPPSLMAPRTPTPPPLPRGPGGPKSLQIARTMQSLAHLDLWDEYIDSWSWAPRAPILNGLPNLELFQPELDDLISTCKVQVEETVHKWVTDQRTSLTERSKILHAENGTTPQRAPGAVGLTALDVQMIALAVQQTFKEASKTKPSSSTSSPPATSGAP
jgi:hypothetical protein